jgi:hypothetical protein
MQQELIAGDTLNFLTTVTGYSAADGWVLNWRLVPRTIANPAIVLTSTAEGSDYRTQSPAATTATWAADAYTWTSWVSKGAEVYTVDSGQITIKPNPRTVAAGYDGRSEARKALEQARAALTTYTASQGMTKSYKIADRERVFNSAAEIIKLITYLEAQVTEEERLAGRAEKPSRRIYSRI